MYICVYAGIISMYIKTYTAHAFIHVYRVSIIPFHYKMCVCYMDVVALDIYRYDTVKHLYIM